MDGESWEAIAAHHDRVLPHDRGARRDLAQGDHPPGYRAPDLAALNRVYVVALGQGRTSDDRQQPGLLREDSHAGGGWLAVEADHAPFKTAFQGPGHLDARDAGSAGLEFEQVGADDLDPLTPIAAHALCPAVLLEHFPCLVAQFVQFRRIGTAEARLDPPALPRAKEELLGDGVGVGVLPVQVFLNLVNQAVDLPRVIDIDEKLNECLVLPLRGVDEHETQAAAADERGDVGDAGLTLDVPLDLAGKRLRFADVRARREEDIHHELRSG